MDQFGFDGSCGREEGENWVFAECGDLDESFEDDGDEVDDCAE